MSDRPCGLTFHEGMFASYTTAGPLFSVGKLVCQQLAAQDLLTEKADQRIVSSSPTVVLEVEMPPNEAESVVQAIMELNKEIEAIVREKGYGRIAHLAQYAKSIRARERNMRRAYDIFQGNWVTK